MQADATTFVLGAGLVATLVIWLVPKWPLLRLPPPAPEGREERVKLENELRQTCIQALGGFVVLYGGWTAWQSFEQAREAQVAAERSRMADQNHTAEAFKEERDARLAREDLEREAQIATRYSHAIDQLGSTQLAVRLGGIYALERIAKDSPRDHPTVMEVLAAYVRERQALTEPAIAGEPGKEVVRLPGDVQACLTVIGRRNTQDDRGAIDLSGTDLSAANLMGARLSNVILAGSRLRGATLICAEIRTPLLLADLRGALLTGAKLDQTKLQGADLRGAMLDQARGLTREQIDAAVIDDKTVLDERVAPPGHPKPTGRWQTPDGPAAPFSCPN